MQEPRPALAAVELRWARGVARQRGSQRFSKCSSARAISNLPDFGNGSFEELQFSSEFPIQCNMNKPPSYPGFFDPVQKLETAHHVIRAKPRISAAKLAEYVVANPARQETIVRNSKKAPKVLFIQYREARVALGGAFGKNGIDPDQLLVAANECSAGNSGSDWQIADDNRSAEALRHIARIADQLECTGARRIPRPQSGWGAIDIAGVKVSVNPEVVFSLVHRGVSKAGAIILNIGQNIDSSLDRNNGRYCAGDYLSTLAFLLLERRLKGGTVPLHSRCYAVDVYRDKVHKAPVSQKTLLKHLEAACRTIKLQWPTIEVGPEAMDEEVAAEF
jgi:hypothetical protein